VAPPRLAAVEIVAPGDHMRPGPTVRNSSGRAMPTKRMKSSIAFP
jgi:hypothetical protein